MSPAASAPRLDRLRHWFASQHDLATEACELRLAAGDASFRRYYRATLPDGRTRILMDAPPAREDSRPFVAIAQAWESAGLPVPHLHAIDLDAGFLELEDLGDTPLSVCFDDEAALLTWHERAIALLHRLQAAAPLRELPAYDAALLGRELDLFPEWCLTWLALPTPPSWPALREALIASALAQPRVAVHRDFDAMNLMVRGDALTLIDFQDAVAGPPSYDLISLLRGRYRRFDAATFAAFVDDFREHAQAEGRLAADLDAETWRHQVEAMAAQRALKVLGIFCRLTHRDHKTGYLARLPHFLDHLRDSLAGLPAHDDFAAWLETDFAPALTAALAREALER
ncbi:aminoglycoside phosphotransferase family protein [Halomonas sp. 328]|uniref:aminoglycoside phosphotransferase family protein n=1 Tax=Halomonas sp. 328 TaxID=2776704 RepID=UPI0018A6E200|nr:phosphotransferase [Halomonas sp. 328]MBF8223850.1 phosphotransferase [Halomonas sp. 328]